MEFFKIGKRDFTFIREMRVHMFMQKGDKLQVKFHIDWKINVLVYLVLNDKEISKS